MEILTKGEYAYRRLHDDILSGKIPAGSRLIVNDLVKEYQMSSMPIRNAITRLEELGFVHTVAHQGAWVTEMNLRNYFTFMLLRIEAEALAARFAAKNCDDALIRDLEDLYHKMEAARDAKDYETYGRTNRKSHNLVCQACQNSALLEYINILMSRTQLAVSFFNIVPESSRESCQEHYDWIQALRAHDVRRSMAIIRYQRCRANLELMDAITKGSPAIDANPFLKRAASGPEAELCINEFQPIFQDILEQNNYRKFSDEPRAI